MQHEAKCGIGKQMHMVMHTLMHRTVMVEAKRCNRGKVRSSSPSYGMVECGNVWNGKAIGETSVLWRGAVWCMGRHGKVGHGRGKGGG